MRPPLGVAGLALVAAGLPLTAPPALAAESCQGKPATIVQTTGTVNGTEGDDVIIGGKQTTVRAGAGNDTVCASGGTVDGGSGIDSIEMIGQYGDEPGATVVDFERLDVRTFYNLGSVDLEWTEVPSELSGAVDAGFGGPAKAAKVLDNPTVDLKVPESSSYGLRVDRRKETVSLGANLMFTLTGVDDIGMTAHRIRAFGDAARNFFFLTGCDVVAKGGPGNDRLWATNDKKVDKSCPGLRLFGQRGPDKLRGSDRDDALVGGKGKDRADGGKGNDRCVAEKKSGCER